MIQADKRYIHGTAAEKLQYDVYEENKVLKEKKRRKLNGKLKVKAVCIILFLFSLCFITILRYAMITELSYKIDSVNNTYNEIAKGNDRLKVELESKTNLCKIEEIATTELGMQKPSKYQIIYVNVPKKDYTIVSESYSSKFKEGNLIAYIGNKLEGMVQLLF